MYETTNDPDVPAACTLPTALRPLRRAEFNKFFATAVRAVERLGPRRVRMELDPDPKVAGRAADLLVRETECCSFFTFTLTATGGRLALDVEVPEGHIDVLDSVAERAGAIST